MPEIDTKMSIWLEERCVQYTNSEHPAHVSDHYLRSGEGVSRIVTVLRTPTLSDRQGYSSLEDLLNGTLWHSMWSFSLWHYFNNKERKTSPCIPRGSGGWTQHWRRKRGWRSCNVKVAAGDTHRPDAAALLRCRQALNFLRKLQCFLNCVYRFTWRCPTPTTVPVTVGAELRPGCAESACPELLMVSISPPSYLPPFHFLGKSAQILTLSSTGLISKEISNLLALFFQLVSLVFLLLSSKGSLHAAGMEILHQSCPNSAHTSPTPP